MKKWKEKKKEGWEDKDEAEFSAECQEFVCLV